MKIVEVVKPKNKISLQEILTEQANEVGLKNKFFSKEKSLKKKNKRR
jgi:hypothetical protein